MRVGDPKQASSLAIVAVLAIGFLLFRLRPSPEIAAKSKATADMAPGELVKNLTFQLKRDPFSSELLARRGKPTSGKNAPPPTERVQTGLSPISQPLTVSGILPGAAFATTVPEDAPKSDRPKSSGAKPKTVLRLDATMDAGEPTAMISIDGEDARMFRSGDPLERSGRILSVDDAGADIVVGGKKIRLVVGQEKHV